MMPRPLLSRRLLTNQSRRSKNQLRLLAKKPRPLVIRLPQLLRAPLRLPVMLKVKLRRPKVRPRLPKMNPRKRMLIRVRNEEGTLVSY